MEKLYLEELIAEGLSQKQIAVKSDRDRSTVKRWLKQYGLKTQNPPKPEYTLLTRSFLEGVVAEGLSVDGIVKEIGDGRTIGSVKYWLEKYGLKTDCKGQARPFKCKFCGETDPEQSYARVKSECKACRHYHDAIRIRGYKEQAVKAFGGKCVRCGYNKCVGALEFHHTDPAQKDPDFKRMRSWSHEQNRAEFEKCELLCSNCHRETHYKELQAPVAKRTSS